MCVPGMSCIKKGNFRCRFCIVFFVSSLGIAFGASTMVRLLCYCAFDALIVNDVHVPPHASPPFTSLIFNEQPPGTQYTRETFYEPDRDTLNGLVQ